MSSLAVAVSLQLSFCGVPMTFTYASANLVYYSVFRFRRGHESRTASQCASWRSSLCCDPLLLSVQSVDDGPIF